MKKSIFEYLSEDPGLYKRIKDYLKEAIKKGRIKNREDILKELDLTFGTNAGKGVLNNLEVNTLNKILKERFVRKALTDDNFIIKKGKNGKEIKYMRYYTTKSFKQQEKEYKKQQELEAVNEQKRLKIQRQLPKLTQKKTEYTPLIDKAIKARKGKPYRTIANDINKLFGTSISANAARLRLERIEGKRK